jgi:hypothetical protein
MNAKRLVRAAGWALFLALPWMLASQPAQGYVEAAYPLGRTLTESTNVVLVRVEKVDKTKNLIIYRKVRDIKGTHPGETIKHDIGQRGFAPREWQNVMAWADVGKSALIFHNGGASETCIDGYWYQCYAGEWWAMSHSEPFFGRSYCGSPEKLAGLITSMMAGQEVIVPCMVDGDKNALHMRTARLQRMKASLKIQDYNPQRDFMGWGVEEFRAITNMPGFTHYAPIAKVYPDAIGVAAADFSGDGKPDLCLYGANKVVLLKNGGDSFDEVSLPLEGGARSAAWADYDGDGKVDLLLATPTGPRLFRNEGTTFRDITAMLPRQPYENLTAAAWIDNGTGKHPDILLADGFLGLRLLRNNSATVPTPPAPAVPGAPPVAEQPPASPKPGVWYHAGPFDNAGNKGFANAYPPEKEFSFAGRWDGKGGARARWREGTFEDGKVNSLALYRDGYNDNTAVYLYRELDYGQAMELPVSFGSHDTLTVWLNGQKVLEQNVTRPCAADQAQATLKLKAGRNILLMKVCSQSGPGAFYFAAKKAVPSAVAAAKKEPLFADVSDSVGLGVGGVGGKLKGDHLAVADVNGDGRPDILYSAGAGLLILNTPKGFVAAEGSGIAYRPGRVTPVFGDFDGDGAVDLFVPQDGACKLFKGDGKGHFTDVTAAAGLAGPIPLANCAAWSDFNNRGKLDLFVGCLKGPNRYFRNLGGGKFADAGNELGFYRRIFNTRGLAVVDMNKDGVMDLVFTNEGQESSVLLSDHARVPAAPAAPAVAASSAK